MNQYAENNGFSIVSLIGGVLTLFNVEQATKIVGLVIAILSLFILIVNNARNIAIKVSNFIAKIKKAYADKKITKEEFDELLDEGKETLEEIKDNAEEIKDHLDELK